MTVYVDDMRARFRRMVMCHMIADTEAELHAMAASVGVKPWWFQSDHYDLSRARRARAVKLGAVEITQRQAAAMMANRRWSGKLGDPQTAVRDFKNHVARIRAGARAIVEATR